MPSKFIPPRKPQTASASWGGVANWYTEHLESPDTYHDKVLLPHLLRLVEPKSGEHILDLACGDGYFTRAFAAKGATLVGVDVGAELIAIAKKRSPEIDYRVASADDLSGFEPAQFNKATMVLAIQNIENVPRMLIEANRVLSDGGVLHIAMNHPAFRIPKHSSWGYEDKAMVQYRRVDQYLSDSREEIEMHPGMRGSPRTLSFHRPLQYYVKALTKAGFVIDRLEEWISHKTSDSGPRARAENRARKEIPLFLYIRGRKDR